MEKIIDRYSKQRIFLGIDADISLRFKRVAVIGLGATGSIIASWLARAGIGHLTLIDRDIIDGSNLQRQILFQESDLLQPKVDIAASRLNKCNSEIEIEKKFLNLSSSNAEKNLSGFDLIIDGTDNFETRFLINDCCILTGTPWIYSGVIGAQGTVWPILLPKTPCLRCLIEKPSDDSDSCNSKGILGPSVGIIGSWASLEALKILTGKKPHLEIAYFDFWNDERYFFKPPIAKCRFCCNKITDFLNAKWTIKTYKLCGLNGLQIRVNPDGNINLEKLLSYLENKTRKTWKLRYSMLSGQYEDLQIMIFKDGRVLINGNITTESAISWYNEVVGPFNILSIS